MGKTRFLKRVFILFISIILLLLTVITDNLFTIKSFGVDLDSTIIEDALDMQAPEKEDIKTWNSSKNELIVSERAQGAEIPTKFDLRDYINLKVETQFIDGTTYAGTCYAFASLNPVESYIMLKGGEEYNFSEMHVEYITYNGDFTGGGFSTVTSNYFKKTKTDANGNTVPLGPVLESEIPYRKYSTTEVENKLKKATPIVKVEEKTSYADEWSDDSVSLTAFRNMIKTHIMENGALYAYMYWNGSYYNSSTAGFYYNGSTGSNHAVTIIGWDDNYSKYNFNNTPSSNGAWIALNSYYKGSSHGDNGVIYISYKDVYINDGMQGVTKVSALNDTEGPNITMSNYKNENNTINIDVDVIDNGANGLNFDELKYQWTNSLSQPSKESFTEVVETEIALEKLNTMTFEKTYEDGEEWHLWILAVDNGGNYTIVGDNEVLESAYDLRDHMNIKIESQYMDTEDGKEYLATGYAFSTLNAVETNIMINGGQEYDFSEMHVEYIGQDGDFSRRNF